MIVTWDEIPESCINRMEESKIYPLGSVLRIEQESCE